MADDRALAAPVPLPEGRHTLQEMFGEHRAPAIQRTVQLAIAVIEGSLRASNLVDALAAERRSAKARAKL